MNIIKRKAIKEYQRAKCRERNSTETQNAKWREKE